MASIDVRLLSRRFDVLEQRIVAKEAQLHRLDKPRSPFYGTGAWHRKYHELVAEIMVLHQEQIGTVREMVELIGGSAAYYAYTRERSRNNQLSQ